MATHCTILQQSKYKCIECDYLCYKKSEWLRHTNTPKHINATQCYTIATETKNMCHNCNKTFAQVRIANIKIVKAFAERNYM